MAFYKGRSGERTKLSRGVGSRGWQDIREVSTKTPLGVDHETGISTVREETFSYSPKLGKTNYQGDTIAYHNDQRIFTEDQMIAREDIDTALELMLDKQALQTAEGQLTDSARILMDAASKRDSRLTAQRIETALEELRYLSPELEIYPL